jgi:probable F420-dependent oxidoreductase
MSGSTSARHSTNWSFCDQAPIGSACPGDVGVKFGVFLPTFQSSESPEAVTKAIRSFASTAEELGFDSLWVTDHLLQADRFYSVPWLEPVTTLSYAAAVTERVSLGTSVLCMPLRQPVILAKEMATLHYLSNGRFIMGAGTGWFPPEFEAVGVPKKERGRRTDEVLDISRALLSQSNVSYHGRHYSIDDVTIEPRLAEPPPVWVAGGSQLPHELSPEKPEMNPRVLDRIVASDGWIARVTCPPDLMAEDARLIRDRIGDRTDFSFVHENFVWIDESRSHDETEELQKEKFGAVLSDERPWSYIQSVYLTGTIDEIHEKIKARRDAGIEYMTLHTLNSDVRQVELIAEHIVKPLRDL